MDLVVNHTSDEHAWFEQSKQPGTEHPYHDFYFWKEGKDGGPPNNWQSFFGGPAWTYVPAKDLWYLHLFSTKQPDLNWENPTVREEVKKILRFWLDKGIDGFRMDVIPCISKHLDFADADISNFGHVIEHVYSNGPRVHEFLQEINRDVLSHYDVMTVGEGPGITMDRANLYVGKDRQELDMIFHLDHMGADHGPGGRFDPRPQDFMEFKQIWAGWDEAIADQGWLSVFLDNHDFPRMVSRFGDDGAYRVPAAKLLSMMILTLRGTPCIYYGSEIGMTNVKFDSIEDYRDVETLNFWEIMRAQGLSEQEYLQLVQAQGRDNVRTPMQWDDSLHAGFTSGTPWIKSNPNSAEINVQNDHRSPGSILRFYQQMIHLRKQYETFVYGKFEHLEETHPELFIYDRQDEQHHFRIVLNFSEKEISNPQDMSSFRFVIGNDPDPGSVLKPWEGQLWKNSD